MNGIEDYRAFLAKVSEETGIAAFKPSEDGLASMRVDDAYNVNLQFIEATGKVLCFIEVMELPPDTPKAVYRDLLAGGLFGKDTAGGYFSLEPETETVVYSYFFDLETAANDGYFSLEPETETVVYSYFFDLETAANDIEEFIHTIEKILQLCDLWAERIKGDMSADGDEKTSDPSETPLATEHTIFRV